MKKKNILLTVFTFFALSLTNLTGCTKAKNYDFKSVGEAKLEKAGEDPYTIRDIKKEEGWLPAPTTGKSKYLVIPVDFNPGDNAKEDYSCSVLPKGCEGTKAEIEAAFFGKSEDTGWESVKSFYYKSSYGALDFEGVVTDWYRVGSMVVKDENGNEVIGGANNGAGFTAKTASTMGSDYTKSVARAALNWYKSDLVKKAMGESYIDPKDLDSDHDGYVDAVALIYAAPEKLYGADFFWAYTTFNFNEVANVESPNVYQMFWGSYNFIYGDETYEKPDSHTYIHETGHVLGLNDYYNTSKDASTSRQQPAGKVDMMDNNVGDHCAYSKYSLGWIKPYVVNQEGSFKIKPFQENGDCIIISPNFNGSAFDEYLMIEFHTPTNLNEKDSITNYANNYPLVMNTNGIKVYHIDSRLAVVDRQYNTFVRYTDELVNDNVNKTILAHSNTPKADMHPENPQVHLLEATGKNLFIEKGIAASNSTLFKVGQQFGVNIFKDFKFNDGSDLPYVFEITSISNEEAVITFLKK